MTTATLVYAGADLPPRVQRSIARAMDPNFPIELTASERVALAALLRRVEARDGHAAFWVRRLNLADVFGRVERTISNWLTALESKGLIEKEQGRTRWGNFSCVTLHLTQLAVSLLGLSPDQDFKPAQPKKIAGGYKEDLPNNTKTQSTRYPQADLSTDSGTESRSERGIPEDCAPLLHLGLRPSAVFKLMKIATSHGKRLGDIVKARLAAIRRARRPYGLIAMLAAENVDYAWVHRQESKARQEREDESRAHATRGEIKARLSGRWVQRDEVRIQFSPDGIPSIYKWDGSSWYYAYALAGPRLLALWDQAYKEQWHPEPD
jgi:hypothetical protein